MSRNTVKGTNRTLHTTPQGVQLERSYIYLTSEAWNALYAASSAAGLSASQYIASLVTTTQDGTTNIKDSTNDTTSTSTRPQ